MLHATSEKKEKKLVYCVPKSFCKTLPSKRQLISKCLLDIFNSPKKGTKKIKFTTMVPQVELFSFVFWENSRQQKDISKLTDL